MTEPVERILLLDASVLINLTYVGELDTLARIYEQRISTTKVVSRQVSNRQGQRQVRQALGSGRIQLVDEFIPARLLPAIPELVRRFGEQDTSLLINALVLDAILATDDRKLTSEAQRRGVEPVVSTAWLLAELVRSQAISLRQGNLKLRSLREVRFISRVPCLCQMCGVACQCP